MTTITAGAVTVGGLFVTGFVLGLGFWASKKLTNVVDRRLVERDPIIMANLYPSKNIPAPVQGL